VSAAARAAGAIAGRRAGPPARRNVKMGAVAMVRFTIRGAAGPLTLLLLVTLLLPPAPSARGQAPADQNGVIQPLSPVRELRSLTGGERLRGVVLPGRQVTLNAPLPGILETLHVEEGDRVEQNTVLLSMDDDLQAASVTVAEMRAASDAQVRQAELELSEAQIRLEQMEQAARTAQAFQEWELRQARVRRDLAQANLEAARENRQLRQAELELERTRLDRYEVHAPFDGRVIQIATDEGATLTQDDAILRFVSLRTLKARVFVPVDLYGELHIDRVYELQALEPVNRTLRGELKVVDPVIDMPSRSFTCVFEIDNADERLPAGFEVRLIWPQEGEPVEGEGAAAADAEAEADGG